MAEEVAALAAAVVATAAAVARVIPAVVAKPPAVPAVVWFVAVVVAVAAAVFPGLEVVDCHLHLRPEQLHHPMAPNLLPSHKLWPARCWRT